MKRSYLMILSLLMASVACMEPVVAGSAVVPDPAEGLNDVRDVDQAWAGGEASALVVETVTAESGLVVTVTAEALEIRSQPNGENLGYWNEGAVVELTGACLDGEDVWVSFAGGWSAAVYRGRVFVSPVPAVVEGCDE